MQMSLPVKKVNLMFTACNLSCPMCSVNANAKDVPQILRDYPDAATGPQLTLDEYKKFFSDIKEFVPQVSIAGGEPSLFYHLPELIKYIKEECGSSVGVTTNGTNRSDRMVEGIARYADGVTVSLDGMRETHDSIRGEGNFDKAISFMRSVLKYKIAGSNIRLYSLLALQIVNHTEVADVVEYLFDEVGIDSMTISSLVFSTDSIIAEHSKWISDRSLDDRYQIAFPRGGVSGVDELYQMDYDLIWNDKEKVTAKYKHVRYEPDFQSLEDMKTYFLTNKHMPEYFDSKCNPSVNQLVLLSNGDILFLPGCFQMKMGNIREQSVRDIWNSNAYNNVRSVLADDLSPICSHCCGNRKEKNF